MSTPASRLRPNHSFEASHVFAPVVAPRSAVVQTDESVLGTSIVVRGEITGEESLHILGHFEGSIDMPGCYVQVGPAGSVSSNITAREVVVRGSLNGNVQVNDRVDVRNGASLTGDVVAKRISVQEGAFLNSSFNMLSPESLPEAETAAATEYTLSSTAKPDEAV